MINKSQFPIFKIEAARNNYLKAKQLCEQGLDEASSTIAELMTERLTALPYEVDELEQDIAQLLSHITFCLDALDEVNSELNHMGYYFN